MTRTRRTRRTSATGSHQPGPSAVCPRRAAAVRRASARRASSVAGKRRGPDNLNTEGGNGILENQRIAALAQVELLTGNTPGSGLATLALSRRGRDNVGVPRADLAEAGLSRADVAERVATGEVNSTDEQTARPISTILRANIFTRFNAILGSLLVVVAVVGPPQDGLFGVVLVVNTTIGIAQELRARRTLERLAVLTAPTAHA